MAMRTPISGILAPIVTTFDPSGEALDLVAFAANIHAHLAVGLAGIVVAGSTGEAPLLGEAERVALVEAAREAVPLDRWLLVGVGAESTRLTVERARAAAARGADAVLVVAPHYYAESSRPEVLLAHYTRVADESPIPVLLYNIAKYMHFALPPAVVHRLAEHPNVVGMKDSDGNLAAFGRYLEAQSPGFSVLTGSASTLKDSLAAGARGGILAVALFAPSVVRGLVDALAAGRAAEAAAAQARLLPLGREIVSTLGVPGVKAAMDAVGLTGGRVRSPLLPVDAATADRIAALVADLRPSRVQGAAAAGLSG